MNKLKAFFEDKAKVYLSGSEARAYLRIRHYRDSFFSPACAFLAKHNVSAEALSYFGIFCAMGFAVAFAFNLWLALFFLILNLLLDGLDGALARFYSKPSARGAFTDITVDYVSFFIIFLTLLYFKFLDPFWGSLYLINYIVLIFLSIILNYLEVKVFPVLKSKSFIYFLFLLFVLSGLNWFDPVLVFFSVYMLVANSFLFYKLRCLI